MSGNPLFLGYTADRRVVHDRHFSHMHCSKEDAMAAIQKVRPTEWFNKFEVEFDDRSGWSECVETTQDDTIVMRHREGRDGFTRFVKNRKPVKTNILTILLLRSIDTGGWVLISAFWGKSEIEPWDRKAFIKDPRGAFQAMEASKRFWNNHALILKEE
jgi:hypothetical protein